MWCQMLQHWQRAVDVETLQRHLDSKIASQKCAMHAMLSTT